MATKKLSPVPSTDSNIPTPTLPETPGTQQGLPALQSIRPTGTKGSQTKSTKERERDELRRKIKADMEGRSFFDVSQNKYFKGVEDIKDTSKRLARGIAREGAEIMKMSRTVIPDTLHFFGGIGVDAVRAFDPRMIYDDKYRDYFMYEYAPKSTLYDAAVSFKDTLQFWDTIPEYIDTIESGQPISPLLIRDAGNLSIVAGGLAKGFKAAAIRNAAKAEGASAAAAAGAFADDAAAAAANRYANRMKKTATVLNKAGNTSGRIFYYSNEIGMVPFKPWIWTGSKLGAAKRNGIYFDGIGGWGARAAEGYKEQIAKLREAEPDIAPNDPRLKDLQTKLARNLRMSLTHATKAQIRQAVRNQQHESDLIKKTLLNIQKSPKYVDEINEATGEKWGELSQAENEAVIAVLNGRANLVAWLVENLNMSPEQVSVLGRYDASPEFYLSEAGSRLAYDMLTGNVDNIQYERLADAVFRIGRVMTDVTQRAVEGYGRRTALSPDYLKPVPFWNKLRVAVRASKNPDLIELVETLDSLLEDAQSGEVPMTKDGYEDFIRMRDEISVAIVEQLPDELALDPDMYPANMRENIEFFRRVRRSWNQDLIAEAEGEPLPPRDGGPRSPETPWFPFEGREPPVREGGFSMPRGRGRLTASTDMIKRLRANAEKLRLKIIEITDKIAKLEEKHIVLIQRLRRYDVVEAYIAGKTSAQISKKFRIPVAEVEKIIKSSALRKAYDTMKDLEAQISELQNVIGSKRARLRGPEADAELVALQGELEVAVNEARNAQQALQAAKNINEIARQADESQVDKLTEEQDKLDDELFDAERDFENSGGDIESLHENIDPTNTEVFPVSIDAAFQMVLSLQFMVDGIDPVLRSNGASNVADAISRVVKTLELTLNDAETLYTEASTPSRTRLADLRIQQLGGLLAELSTRINELQVDPPDGVLLEQAIADQILSVVDSPQNKEIIAGTAPLSAEPTKSRAPVSSDASGLYDIFDDYGLAEDGRFNVAPYKINNLPVEDLDFLIETLDPQNYPLIEGASVFGDMNTLITTANILARWIREIKLETNETKKIYLIWNPPEYVPYELSKKLLHGVTRDPARLKSMNPGDATHPLRKIENVYQTLTDDIIKEIGKFAFAYKKFGSIRFVDWTKFPGMRQIKDWSGNATRIEIYPTSIPADGVVPRIRFEINTPVESVLEGIDALIFAIENDRGANIWLGSILDEMSPAGFGDELNAPAFDIDIEGLTKKNAKYKDKALKELLQLRAKIESAKTITPEQLAENIVDPKRLPGVETTPIVRVPAESKLAPVKTPVPENIAPDSPGRNPLPDKLEEIALEAANDELYYEELVNLSQDAALLESTIEDIKNPTPEQLAKYKEDKLKEADQEIYDLNGLALSNLAGGISAKGVINTADARWYVKVEPKGAAEWDWWYKLDGRTRQRLARTYFVSTPLRAPGSKKIVREAQGIDVIADQAGMTVDEWAEAFLEHDRVLTNAKRRRKELKSLKKEELAGDFVEKEMYDIQGYIDKYEETGITAEQYQQILDRVDFIKAEDTGNVPANLRPIAKSPEDVVPDPAIVDPTVRQAAYEVDVVDAMAKDAANKMRRAKKTTERVKAFDEFVKKAGSYDEAVARFNKVRAGREKTLTAISINEERQRKLREKMKTAKNLERRLKRTEKMMVESPQLERIEKMRGSIPLKVALEGGYPSEQFSVDVRDIEGNLDTTAMVGPMYLPTGRPRGFTGALKVEQLKRGLEGFQTLSSEHYRDGDRHTIFSIRQLALRLGNEMSQITGNEAYKAIVAQFGSDAVSILGEELSLSLYEKAYDRVASMPLAEQIRLGYTGIIEEQTIGPDGNIAPPDVITRRVDDGIAAYSQGVTDPAAAFNLALKEEFGRLIAQEMAFQGYTAVDPFRSIGATLAFTKVTHKSMFLPTGLRELIATTQVVSDPSTWNRAIRAASKVTGVMKTSTLVFSATWQLGDLISNVMLSAMSGQDVSVRDMIKRMRDIKRKEYGPGIRGLIDPRAETPSPTPDVILAQEAPIQDIGASQAERRYIYGIPETADKPPLLTRVFKKEYPEPLRGRSFLKASFRFNEAINRISRHAYFLELLENALEKRGLSIEQISDTWRSDAELRKLVFEVAETANDFLGDFADLELWERKLVAVGVPFYSWQKHIHKVFMLLGRENPQALRWYFYMGAINYDPDEDPMNLRYGGLGLFGGVVSTNIFNPIGDVVGGPIPSFVFEGDVRPALNMLGPVPRLSSAYVLGQDITKMQPISRPAGTASYTQSGQLMATPLFNRPEELVGYTMQQFPIVPRFLNILPEGKIPGTNIATGPVSRYGTGEARLSPSGQTVRRPGGQLAAIGRLFSLPGIPYQSDEQLLNIEASARQRLRTINALRRRRAAQTGEEYIPVGE